MIRFVWAACLIAVSLLVPTADRAGTATTNLSVNIQPVGASAYQPPTCVPGHSLVRGRTKIVQINGVPTLVTDNGCLLYTYDGFGNGNGPPETQGVDLQWAQQVNAAGFNAIATPTSIQADGQPDCQFGYPYSQTLSQFVTSTNSTIDQYLAIVSQTGMYLIIQPTQCNQWASANNGPAGPFSQSLNDAFWAAIAQKYGAKTNVIFMEGGEPEGFSNWSCSMEASMSDQDYQTIRSNGAPNTLWLAFSDFSFGQWYNGHPDSNCGPYSNLTSQTPHIDWSNAAISFSLLNMDYPNNIGAMIDETAANGQAMFSYEGAEDPSDCAFGSHSNALQLKEAMSFKNSGWQCDDGWSNGYGTVTQYWSSD